MVKDLVVIINYRYKNGEVELDVGKTLDKHFPSSDEEEEDKEVSNHRSYIIGSEDLSESSWGSEFASVDDYNGYDGYNLSIDLRVDKASSEIDEDDTLFAPLDGYDSSGNPRVDVDLTMLTGTDNAETDAKMEDGTIPPEETSTHQKK